MIDSTLYAVCAGLSAAGTIATGALVRSRAAVLIIFLFLCCFAAAVGGVAALDGGPKSVASETARPGVATVLWHQASRRDDRVYVLLVWPGHDTPALYWLPFSADMDKQLSQGRRESAARGRPLMVRDPFGAGGLQGEGGGQGAPGNGKPGRGHGSGEGPDTGDNRDAEQNRFYLPPPAPLPEKDPTESGTPG